MEDDMQSQMPFSNRASEEPFADSAMTAFTGAPGPGRFGSEATIAAVAHIGPSTSYNSPRARHTGRGRLAGSVRKLAGCVGVAALVLIASLAEAADVRIEARSHLDAKLTA